MAQRTGLQAYVKGVKYLCRLYGVFAAAMKAAINATPLTSEQKAQGIAALEAVHAACDVFELFFREHEV